MTNKETIELGFTHEGQMFENYLFFKFLGINFVPIYLVFDDEEMTVGGKTIIWDAILSFFLFLESILKTGKGFECWINSEPIK